MGKRINKKVILAAIAVIVILCAAGIIRQHTRSKETGFRLHVSSDSKQKMNIPDPSTANGVSDVTIDPVKEENLDDNGNLKNIQMVDLSFLGLKEKAYIIRYAKGQYKNSKKDDYLALILGTKKSQYAYFAILDYKNQKSYLIKTGQLTDNVDQINHCNLTEDGKEEWIVSGIANKWIEWNAYQIQDGKLKEIRCKYKIRDYKDEKYKNCVRDAFHVKYIADDKIQISCQDSNFKKVINIKDVDDDQTAQITDSLTFTNIEKENYDWFKNINKEKGICYPLDLEVGHGTICAEIEAYLKYDKSSDMIKIYKVDFKVLDFHLEN